MKGTIAVVVPAYNAERSIGYALDSLLKQSRPPDQIVVVDDGSKDATVEAITPYLDNISFIRQENQGSASARQRGTEAADAEYIAYLDADDWWPADKLEQWNALVEKEEVSVLIADLQRAKNDWIPSQYLPRNSTFYPWIRKYLDKPFAVNTIPDLYRFPAKVGIEILLKGFPVYPSTMIAKKAALVEVGGWNTKFRRCQDFDMGLRLAKTFPLHYYHSVQAVLGLHDVNSDVRQYVEMQTKGDIDVLLHHLNGEPKGSDFSRKIEKALVGKYCALAYNYRLSSQYPMARNAYLKASRWPGRRIHTISRAIASYFHL